jgi:hypothetical protein
MFSKFGQLFEVRESGSCKDLSAEVLSIISRASYIDIYLKGILNSSTKISSPTNYFGGFP